MREASCDVLVVGGGVGGCAAAMAACSLGFSVILTEPTDWIGGQLTSQAVPPDEHPWIEQFGCTRRYRRYRDLVRRYYRENLPLNAAARNDQLLNPGGGWVSFLCHEPKIAWQVLNSLLQPYVTSGQLQIRLEHEPIGASTDGDEVRSVRFRSRLGEEIEVRADYILDATELGDLLELAGVEHVVGAESKGDTGEAHAFEGTADPQNQQGITWVFALGWEEGGENTIDKPADYDRWREYKPEFWAGPLLGWDVIKAHSGEPGYLPLFNLDDPDYELFTYRQVVDPTIYENPDLDPVTLVNWPQNDYFLEPLIQGDSEKARNEAKSLGLSLLYWMQTEAPRHDGGTGYPELYLRPDIMGTEDGFAKEPYIRESRRIKAEFTVLEQHVSTADNPGQDRAQEFSDSVGIGAYRIDLHPSTSGAGIIDFSSLPFQIPLGALIPVRVKNLLPACKNIGTTHITNGCYRLHPVEWNIGEAAGLLAGFCMANACRPRDVREQTELLLEFQMLLIDQGIELEWPRLRPL